jgi:hypothetical protein
LNEKIGILVEDERSRYETTAVSEAAFDARGTGTDDEVRPNQSNDVGYHKGRAV